MQDMNSIILSGGSKNLRQDHIITTYPGENFNIYHIEKTGASIPIAEIHELTSHLATIPPKSRLVWIEEADSLTTQAQNALLKILEEPPHDTTFILTLENHNSILETIRSRCNIVTLNKTLDDLDDSALEIIKETLQMSEGQRLNLLKDIPSNREELLTWLDNIITSLHSKIEPSLNNNQLRTLRLILDKSLEAKSKISANCNIKLTLANYLLSLPQVR